MVRRRSAIFAAMFWAGGALAQEIPSDPADIAGDAPPPAQQSRPDMPAMVLDPAQGQSALPIMTVDPEEMFLQSAWGKRAQVDLETRRQEVAAENERLAEQFSAEEQELTKLRATVSPEEFRTRADDFDKRVNDVRREREEASRALQTRAEDERSAFFRAALPVFAQVMRERGALVVLDQASVFVAAQSIDATEVLIKRMDADIGAGPAEPDAKP